jgi:hypothetical protein
MGRFVKITPEELDEEVRDAIEKNRDVSRNSEAQALLDHCVEAMHAEGELEMATMLLVMSASRVADDQHGMLTVMMQYAADRMTSGGWVSR